MKTLLRLLLLAVCLPLTGVASAADRPAPPVDVRDMMSARQFQAAGLNKLSAQELAALNAWLGHQLRTGTAAPAPAAAPAAPAAVAPPPASEQTFGAPPAPTPVETSDHITSRIAGNFDGFYSGAIFKLANGQVWKETDSTVFKIDLDSPVVHIKKSWSGYLMRLDNYGTQVFVRRIK